MRPSAEARFGVGALLGLQLLTSVSAVVLLGRMAPAVELILEQNVYSTEAVEDMLASLARGGEEQPFEAAFERARGNITEPGEIELIQAIGEGAPAALDGDASARLELVTKLRQLGELNRLSMAQADQEAMRLGLAGAWAMALLGFVGFLANLVLWQRMQTRMLAPILEIDAVLAAARAGDERRRCGRPWDPEAGGRLMENLDWVLDRRAVPKDHQAEDPRLRSVVLGLLDRSTDRPALVVDATGAVVASNAVTLEGLPEGQSAAAVAAELVAGRVPAGWTHDPLADGLWLALGPVRR